MATSSTEIANMALRFLGQAKPIEDLETESSAEAKTCRVFYDEARDFMLTQAPWIWATSTVALGLVTEYDQDTDEEEWNYAYRKPSNCLHPRRIMSGTRLDDRSTAIPFKETRDSQGGLLLTDQEDAYLEYTFREEDCSRYPSDFTFAFAYYLATLIAPSVLGQGAAKALPNLYEQYQRHKAKALARDGNTGRKDLPSESEFVTGR